MFLYFVIFSILVSVFFLFSFFFFNDTATTEIYTLSLHDALPISSGSRSMPRRAASFACTNLSPRSEEHTSELQSHSDLVCRLLLEKKKTKINLFLYYIQKKKNKVLQIFTKKN